MYTASTPILLALLASFPLALCLAPEADGTLPDLGMTYSMVHEQQRTQRISGAKNIAWTVEANQEAVLSLVVPRPVTHGQERFMAVNLSIDALDQAGRALRGDVHIMSFMDALEGDASFFHWSYPEVGGDGKCWVRVHATDKERHPCSTSHVRKHPVLYPVLYPDLYQTGPPGPISQRLQCDMTEFSHMDAETVLNYVHPMNETTPMCLQLRIKLAPASADRQSSVARAFLWYKGKSRPISGRLTSQLNGFFNYADVRDPTTPDYPVSKLFLRGLNYSISAVEGEQPVLRIGSFCSKAFEELSLGNLKDSAPTGNTPPEAKKVDLSPLESIPHPVPKMCYPDLALQDFDDNGNAYRIALRAQAKVMGEHGFSVPEPFHSLGAAKKNRPLTYNYFNTYLSNDTSQFLTIAFQEPVVMFAEGLHTHLVGVARMERVDDSGQYSVYTLPFTLVYLRGYMIRPHVAAYRDDKFGIMLYVRADYAFRKTKCFCGMEGEAIPACTKDDCSEEWKTATPIYLQKVAGVKPMRDCCSTENCLNPNFDWETCRL